MRRALSASQWASGPSPSEVARPMPVIQTSVDPGFGDFVSVIGNRLLRKANALGHGVHMHAQIRMREGNYPKRQGGVAPDLAGNARLGGGNGIAGAFVNDARLYREQFAGTDEAPHLGFLDRSQKRHALE